LSCEVGAAADVEWTRELQAERFAE